MAWIKRSNWLQLLLTAETKKNKSPLYKLDLSQCIVDKPK